MSLETEPRRHPWNTSFEWVDRTGPFRLVSEEQVRQFDDNGFVLLKGILDAPTVARTVEEIDAWEAKAEAALRRSKEGRIGISDPDALTFTYHLVVRSQWCRDLASAQVYADICHDLIGPDVRLYWDQAVYKKPEKPRRFPWHQDNGYTYVDPQHYLTCWTALTRATVDNGCPQVVPGLHKVGTLQHHYVDPLGWECLTEHPDATPVEAEPGDVVVFSSLTPHLTGPNTTDAVRKAYILQYAPDGAQILEGDPAAGPPAKRQPVAAPERQYSVLVGGSRVDPPPMPARR